MSTRRIFISTVSNEFEKPAAAYPGLRSKLRHYLTAADCEVKVQEDFRQTPGGTLEKLDGYIRNCDAIIHLVGKLPGHLADADSPQDVPDFLAHIAAEPGGRTFLDQQPDLRASLGACAGISLTQFEAYMALHHRVPLFVYATPEAASGQQEHLNRLLLGRPRRHASPFTDAADLLGQLIGDLRDIVPALSAEQKIAPTRIVSRHTAADFFGREDELALLDAAWAAENTHVFALIAWGGVGKTALLARWVQSRFAEKGWKSVVQPSGLSSDAAVQRTAPHWEAPLFYFDWTFYDQGTRSDDDTRAGAASVDAFFAAALEFFGDENPALPGKGARLARLVQARRSLLVLDGLEPLQYPFHHPQAGQLTDPDLHDLLVALAQHNPGLCLVSSRQHLSDLTGAAASTAPQHDLGDLPLEVAVRLLRKLQVTGSNADLEQAARDYAGHALTLILLGRFLGMARGGDIRQRDTIPLSRANDQRTAQTRNAWHVLEAYEQWLAGSQGRPEDVQALRLTGLFDRPATPDCLAALRAAPAIPGLTDRLVPLDRDAWNALLRRLHDAHLIQLRFPAAAESPHAPRPEPRDMPVDVHPLIREYFGQQLRQRQPEVFRLAHSRLFDHLCASTEHRPDTLAGLQPLYQAVTHGCLAGRQQEACDKVFFGRIRRGNEAFSQRKLGAIGADLGAVAAFFDEPWTRLSPHLSAPDQAWLLNQAALRLRALGRLTEAVEPMRVSVKMAEEAKDWGEGARRASNLSELEVTLGRLGEAVADGRRAIEFADRSGEDDWQNFIRTRTTAADALHQAGERAEAGALFAEAERMQAESQPEFPLLSSLRGFRYADLLLAPAERAAWGGRAGCPQPAASGQTTSKSDPDDRSPSAGGERRLEDQAPYLAIAEAERRAAFALPIAEQNNWLLDIALDHLTHARAALYHALLTRDSSFILHPSSFTEALAKLRAANQLTMLPKALLTAAFYHGTLGGDPGEAARLLDEAQQIAERGPMPLYLADVHLHRARLVGSMKEEGRRKNWPGVDPKAELAKARTLIEQHGYGRRKDELKDAEAAAANW